MAVHRKHHAFTDEEGDPHSPMLEGFWNVQLGNVFYYVREIKKTDVVEQYARDIKEGWWDTHVFQYGLVGLGVGTTALCLVLGLWWGLLAAGIHAVTYVFFLTSSINGLCHHAGYKNFDNTATNIRTLALITGGEGLHNNHHGYPRSPKFSFKASEIDPAWPIIKLLDRAAARQALQDDRRNRGVNQVLEFQVVQAPAAPQAWFTPAPPTLPPLNPLPALLRRRLAAASPAPPPRRRGGCSPSGTGAAGSSPSPTSTPFQCSMTSGAPP